ncbi:hypothetical protein WA158_006667 [Blastocystis sp. Blastoise]
MSVPPIRPGSVLDNKWILLDKIGKGTYSEIYTARTAVDPTTVAVKVEHRNTGLKLVLQTESSILKEMQPYSCAAKWIDFQSNPSYDYLVMEILGKSISQVKDTYPNHQFDMRTASSIILQVLSCVKQLHDTGYIHRDIKPSNFVFGTGMLKNKIYIIDFGLCRQWKKDDLIYEARPKAQFRGTTLYASPNSHLEKELGRRDDMYSVLFMFIDIGLPWRNESVSNKKLAVEIKRKFINNLEEEINKLTNLPYKDIFIKIFKHIETLSFKDSPDYSFISEQIKLMNPIDNKHTSSYIPGSIEHYKDWKERATHILKETSNLAKVKELLDEANKQTEFYFIDPDGSAQILYSHLKRSTSDLPSIESFTEKRVQFGDY